MLAWIEINELFIEKLLLDLVSFPRRWTIIIKQIVRCFVELFRCFLFYKLQALTARAEVGKLRFARGGAKGSSQGLGT